jgi:ComF family protein
MWVRAPPLLDLLVPVRCAACATGETLLCSDCRAALRRLRPPICTRCGAPTAWPVERCGECQDRRLAFHSARAAVAYEGAARRLLAAWKERGLRRLDRLLADVVTEVVARPAADAITYVPGDLDRTLWRGTNTARGLACELADRWELTLMAPLVRTRRVDRQRGLDRAARRTNVRGAFRAMPPVPSKVILVDDVYTTGATVGAAATELRRAGARVVDVVTLARAVRA